MEARELVSALSYLSGGAINQKQTKVVPRAREHTTARVSFFIRERVEEEVRSGTKRIGPAPRFAKGVLKG
jgi:hypothetical protein